MLADLPLSLHEAVLATRFLGFDFIWIDSLCIIQDSDQDLDWSHEAMLMSEYYANSVCNIAAAKAEDACGGLFTGHSGTQFGRRDIYYVHDSAEQFVRTTKDSTLARRGWVKQELFLAPRTLYFGDEEIFWECSSGQLTESNPFHWLHLPDVNKLGQRSLAQQSSMDAASALTKSEWLRTVVTYSSCDLTFPAKDKLTAIGGIAKLCGPPADYLAGLWKSDLARGLLWRPYSTKKRYTGYTAPSWSWTSREGLVMFENENENEDDATGHVSNTHQADCTAGAMRTSTPVDSTISQDVMFSIVDSGTTLAGMNPFGRISTGFLRLRGVPFLLGPEEYVDFAQSGQHYGSVRKGKIKKHFDDFEKHFLEGQSSWHVLFPVTRTGYNKLYGLILVPTKHSHGEFERAGLFTIKKRKGSVGTSEIPELAEVLGADLRSLRSAECKMKTGNVLHGVDECEIVIV